MKCLIALSLFVALALSLAVNPTDRFAFRDWMHANKKSYTGAEYETRFTNFVKNLRRIEYNNAQFPGATWALNKFSDLSEEEFLFYTSPTKHSAQQLARSCLSQGVTKFLDAAPSSPEAVPASWDWRTKGVVNPVKNQQQCGSCWAFSTIGNIESVYAIKTKKLMSFSEQLIVDCSHSCANEPPYGAVCNQGCGGGWPWSAMSDVLSWGGVMTEAAYPYTAQDGTCKLNKNQVYAKLGNYSCLSSPSNPNGANEQAMASFLVSNGPLSIAMDAGVLMSYTSGVINPGAYGCSSTQLDHAILIVGYGTDSTNVDYWIVRNSWGADWGENGYFRIIRGQGACGLNKAVTCASM
jgi:cathepsin F